MLRVYICTPTNAQFGSDGQQKTRTKTATAAAATMLAHLSDPPFFLSSPPLLPFSQSLMMIFRTQTFQCHLIVNFKVRTSQSCFLFFSVAHEIHLSALPLLVPSTANSSMTQKHRLIYFRSRCISRYEFSGKFNLSDSSES